MSQSNDQDAPKPSQHAGTPVRFFSWLLLFCLAVMSLSLPGCGGCRLLRDPNAKKKLAVKKPKEDYELARLMTLPNNLETLETAIKPGHWSAASLEVCANNADFHGVLSTDPFDLVDQPFRLGTTRPAIMPKGQKKTLDLLLYVPPGVSTKGIGVKLTPRSGRPIVDRAFFPLQMMPTHQFYFVVLARSPDQYRFLRGLDSIIPPSLEFADAAFLAHYRVMAPRIVKRVPLPSNPLTWTTIAYVLWDDIEPALLTREQQSALVDWLHWGGQLIVSGPRSMDLLRGSFLEKYLPARGAGSIELGPESVSPLSSHWSLDQRPLSPTRPWSGVQLAPQSDSTILFSSGGEGDPSSIPLAVERRTGRGRIVVTAFPISQRDLVGWPGYDNFFNACLLRRPGRHFRPAADGSTVMTWADEPHGDTLHDISRLSRVSIFSRDASIARKNAKPTQETTLIEDEFATTAIGSGVAGWNESGDVSRLARTTLRSAAGIRIPNSRFVLRVLAVYLVVLVPVNWLLFKAMGRVELAWVAIPIIAIACAVVVTRMAQLDIGFARARFELAIIEAQKDYPRAHLTRYTALYTSLSTAYQVDCEDPTGLVVPFSTGRDLLVGEGRTDLALELVPRLSLGDYPVSSNSLGMLHGEQMLDLEGTFWLSPSGRELHNDTRLRLDGGCIASPEGLARFESLPSHGTVRLEFEPLELAPLPEKAGEEPKDDLGPDRSIDDVNLKALVNLSIRAKPHHEVRMIAWTSEGQPGVEITPKGSQVRSATLVVAHLSETPLAEPTSDDNVNPNAGRGVERILRGEEPIPQDPPRDADKGNP